MGSLAYLDIIILILIVIFLFFTFKRVLGRDVGFKKPQTSTKTEVKQNAGFALPEKKPTISQPTEQSYNTYPEGSLQYKLQIIEAKDNGFDTKNFISNSKNAFKMIVKSFSLGNIAEIKPFISDKIYHIFQEHINERDSNNQAIFSDIQDFLIADIYNVDINEKDVVVIKVKFVTRQVKELVSKDQLQDVSFAKNSVNTFSEIWSFERNISENTSIWKLIKIQSI